MAREQLLSGRELQVSPGRPATPTSPGARRLYRSLARALGSDGRVLVAYLDCSPRACLAAFRRECARTRARIGEHDMARFDRAAALVERFLRAHPPSAGRGVVLFALPSGRLPRVRQLALPALPVEAVGWIGPDELPRLTDALAPSARRRVRGFS